jgi:hypothetical protein
MADDGDEGAFFDAPSERKPLPTEPLAFEDLLKAALADGSATGGAASAPSVPKTREFLKKGSRSVRASPPASRTCVDIRTHIRLTGLSSAKEPSAVPAFREKEEEEVPPPPPADDIVPSRAEPSHEEHVAEKAIPPPSLSSAPVSTEMRDLPHLAEALQDYRALRPPRPAASSSPVGGGGSERGGGPLSAMPPRGGPMDPLAMARLSRGSSIGASIYICVCVGGYE